MKEIWKREAGKMRQKQRSERVEEGEGFDLQLLALTVREDMCQGMQVDSKPRKLHNLQPHGTERKQSSQQAEETGSRFFPRASSGHKTS